MQDDVKISTAAIDELEWGKLRDWTQLVRIPTVFTLLSNCFAAAVVALDVPVPVTALVPVVLASVMAYWAGMILNDVVDVEEDRQHRPNRPLAAGRVSPVIAGHVASGMLLIGPIVILAVTTFHKSNPLWMGAGFAAAVSLSMAVRIYNSRLKKTPLGPLLMGSCRALNILMVGTTLLAVSGQAEFPKPLLALAAGIGVYIVGVTVYAYKEEQVSSQALLVIGLCLEAAGLMLIAAIPAWLGGDRHWFLDPMRGYPLLVGLVGLTVLNRGMAGVTHPVSRKVQLAVKHALLTLVLIDAAVVFMWAGPWFGGAVALMLVPALASALRFKAT